MDIVDVAQRHEELLREAALDKQRRRSASAERRGAGLPAYCEDCDEAIEPARLSVLPDTPICAYCAHQREARRGG